MREWNESRHAFRINITQDLRWKFLISLYFLNIYILYREMIKEIYDQE